MILLGVCVSAWVIRYTDWFEAFAGLLALGGLFSWLAFVSKLLSEERVKELQQWADRDIFANPGMVVPLAGCFASLALIGCFLGSVQIESLESTDRALRVSRRGAGETDSEIMRLKPGDRLRSVFWTTWWSPADARIKVRGYPALPQTILPWHIPTVYVNGSFLRPVVLLEPGVVLMGYSGVEIHVTLDGRPWDDIPFDGHAVWAGCDSDAEIPEHAAASIRDDVKKVSPDIEMEAHEKRLKPHAASSKLLESGKLLQFQVMQKQKIVPNTCVSWTTQEPVTYADFPKVLNLEVNKDQCK
jgi:hypothetical protein